jgi:hypothetical protein
MRTSLLSFCLNRLNGSSECYTVASGVSLDTQENTTKVKNNFIELYDSRYTRLVSFRTD